VGAIKAVVILCLFALSARQAKATSCEDRIFQEEKINLYLCQNSSGYSEISTLLYKAMTPLLNEYIKDKIAKGELEDKKFEIQIWDGILSVTHLVLTQGQNGYFVSTSGYSSLLELLAIVDYFSNPDWEPFIASVYQDSGLRRIDNFFKKYISTYANKYQSFTVWEKDGITLQSYDGLLRYLIDDTPLSVSVYHNLPIKIQDRYLFILRDSIIAVQDMQTIRSIKREDNALTRDLIFTAHSKWVNIGRDEENWLYSYSYEQNRFFINENRR